MRIVIPTCRQISELSPMIHALAEMSGNCQITPSCLDASAAVNRNKCLEAVAQGEIAIMLDDDIEGFYHDWIDDLVVAMSDPQVVMVSARLLNPDGSFGPTCSRCYDSTPDEIEIKSNGVCVLPTAAIAFRHRGHRFDESFIGSGWEDNDFCFQYLAADPDARFIQSNRCRLIHRNEQKNQHGLNWKFNQAYFFQKWMPSRVTA